MFNTPFTRRNVLGGMLAASALGAYPAPRLAMAASAAQLGPVTIANAAGSVNMTMQELMKQQGFLEEFGLEPNVMAVADGSKIFSGIVGGSIDLSTMSGFGQLFPAIERGANIRILGGAALLPSLAIFTSKPDIKTLKDLEGRTVGTGSLGALLHQLMVAVMRKHGVDVSKVQFVNIGASVDVFKAATMGTVDAGTGELAIIEQQDKYKVRLVENGNLAVELPEYTYQGAWTSADLIEKERDKLVATLAAYAKLYRFVQTPEAKDAFFKARKTILSNATDAENTIQWNVIQTYKPFATDLVLSEERLGYMQQLNIDLKVQTTMLPFDKVADMSIARDAIALLNK
jgi:ABC-type nitrate/sulfonate/bicarbonate transport system substrate-binding protein